MRSRPSSFMAQMEDKVDVIVIGAGVAGLAAACALSAKGISLRIFEARDRIGGRIFTLQDPDLDAPIELGAEFIHGRPPEIWNLLREGQIPVTEVDGDSWCFQDGHLSPCDFFSEVDDILDNMDARKPDQSFQNYLQRCCQGASERTKQHALNYITGFNAADPERVSVHWLVRGMEAEEKIDGKHSFRANTGYAGLLEILLARLRHGQVKVETSAVIYNISWNPENVQVKASLAGKPMTLHAQRVLITVPIGVLQAKKAETGAISFQPALPKAKINAIHGIAMGKVIRVVLRFRSRFWREISPQRSPHETLDSMGFLFSQDAWFPTWWTTMPERRPILTGWAPFRSAERLSGQSREFIVSQALHTLGALLNVPGTKLQQLLQAAHLHDWQTDPFSRGVYSYATAEAADAPDVLAAPVENTLFFAGEATDGAHTGTVHGALASGYRAAAQIGAVDKSR
jgi:monoamine oxidase